jgi:hypothetical protein
MGEVFVTVPFAKPIPKFKILYHSSQKNQTIMVFLKRLFNFFKNPHVYYNKLITYDSFALTPSVRMCRLIRRSRS